MSTRKRYTKEFKLEAVRLLEQGDRTAAELGYKQAKYLNHIELVHSFADIAGGKGRYWEDQGYAWYAGI